MRNKLLEVLLILRLTSFDTSTPEGRAAERHRCAMLTSLGSAFARGVSALTLLISIPLTLGYLGVERFGLWMTISSVISLLGFADLGIGNGLVNAISESNGRGDREAMQKYIASAFLILSLVAILGLLAFAAIYPFISWIDLLRVKSDVAVQEVGPAIAVFVCCFALNIPLGIVQKVQLGLQRGFLNNLWQGVGSAVGLLGLLLAIHLKAGLPWLVLAVMGAPLLSSAASGIAFFGFLRPDLHPRFRFVSGHAIKVIGKVGFLFLILQATAAVSYSADNLIVVRLVGLEAVAQYAVIARMFTTVSVLLGILFGPLWPAYGEAIARGDSDWVRKTLLRSLRFALFFSMLVSLVLVSLGPQILWVWVGKRIDVPFMLLAGLGLWIVIDAMGNCLAMFFNGANVVRLQIILAALFGAICVALKIAFIRRFGVVSVPWATITAYTCISLVPSLIFLKFNFSRIAKRRFCVSAGVA